MRRREHQSGFGTVGVLSIVLVVAVLVATCLVIYQRHNKPSSIKNSAATSQTRTTTQPQSTVAQSVQPDPYQGWNTYNDTGYVAASGLSLKYPSDWEIDITGVKKIGNTKNPTAVINERVVFLPSSETPQEEWNTCATNVSADACGAAPGDKTLSGNESVVNGLAVYTATMQNSYGTYHVTVIRGNKPNPPAGTPFVELSTTSNNQAVLSAYAASITSATFSN